MILVHDNLATMTVAIWLNERLSFSQDCALFMHEQDLTFDIFALLDFRLYA